MRRGIARLRPVRRIRANVLWLGLAPLGIVLVSLQLWRATGDPPAWLGAQSAASAGREILGPIAGIRDGLGAAAEGLRATVTFERHAEISAPDGYEPLKSIPRFLAVLFPLSMWSGWIVERRGWSAAAVAASAVGLGLATTLYSSYQWFA